MLGTRRGTCLCLAAGMALGLIPGCHHEPKPSLVPPQTVEMDNKALDEFYDEIQEYLELRQKVYHQVPPLPVQATAQEIAEHQQALTAVIQKFRHGAKQGEIFKRHIDAAFRRVLRREFLGPDGPALLKAIKQGNPRLEGNPRPGNPTQEVKQPVNVAVNGYYGDEAPFSSVPPSLLLKIPILPEQVRYRFVGRDLIIRDTDANVILDYLKDVVPDPSMPR
jgi:hypothetical protein